MIITKLETYEIHNEVRKVNHYKVSNSVVIEFAKREDAMEYASYFNKIRHIHAECDDNSSVLIYIKDTDAIRISSILINKKDNLTILKIKRF